MIINSSEILYGQEDAGTRAPIALTLQTSGDISGAVKTRVVRRALGLNIGVSGQINGRRRKATSLNLGLKASGNLNGSVRLALVEPAPILNQLAETAFAHQCYAARLLGDNVEIPIRSATVEKPVGEIGAKVSANISKSDLAQLSPGKLYKFQIGIAARPSDEPDWHTILEDAPLDSRSFSRAFNSNAPSDSLTFGAFAPTADRLNKYPSSNQIFYDPAKTEVSAPEATYDNLGNALTPQLVPVAGLNLYYLLGLIKTRCGFSSVETNCPNYEIARFDFSIAQSYRETLNPFVGVFKPLVFTTSNALWILNTRAAIPDEFIPRNLTASSVENLTVSIASGQRLDGMDISFIESSSNFNYHTQSFKYTTESSGKFGSGDSVETKVTREFRDYRHTDNPSVVVKSELKKETREIRREGFLIYRAVTTYNFSSLNRLVGTTKEVHQLLPDFVHPDPGTGEVFYQWMKSRDERTSIQYAQHPFNRRQVYQSHITTEIRGMQAVDSENPYAGQEFIQDFIEAHKAGNLKEGMDIRYGAIKTITERATPKPGGQVEVEIETIDHVRDLVTRSEAEPKTGDIGLNQMNAKSRTLLVWRDGLSVANRDGFPIESFAAGEVPLYFVLPIVQQILKERDEGFQEGTATVIGFDPSLERGTFFNLLDRGGASLGRFVTAGLRVNLENLGVAGQQKVTTEVSCTEI